MKALAMGVCGLAAIPGGTGWAQVTQRVNLSSSGAQADAFLVLENIYASISSEGRWVAFDNLASNLVPGDTNGTRDTFLRDRRNGTTVRISVGPSGVEGDDASGGPLISADGRYVAFTSRATNLVPGDTNLEYDAFVHDRISGTVERVSVSSGEVQGNDASSASAITPDGRYVVVVSGATNFVPGDANMRTDVFVRDRQLGTTELVSVSTGGFQASDASFMGSISADGRFVGFLSYAHNLVPGDTNDWADVFVRDRLNGTTERVSVSSGGAQANTNLGSEVSGSISASGRHVVFTCDASNLVPGDTNGFYDVFIHDRQDSLTERVNISTGGTQANGWSYDARVSTDGRYAVFASHAGNLVAGDTNGGTDVFVRDRSLGTTERVSLHSNGSQGNDHSGYDSLRISDDGRYVVFNSWSANLVPADTNGWNDVFVRDRFGGPDFTSLCDPGVGGVIACPCSNPPSGTERGCDNSSATGGATLSAAGGTYLSSDSLVFTTSAEKPTALSIVTQWSGANATGAVFGQGVRCASGTLKRLYTKSAVGGSITAPSIAVDPQVSVRSAALGDPLQAGESRWYVVYYRDPIVLGGCPATSTFNATQTGRIDWTP